MILRLLIFIRWVSGSFIAALIFLDYSFAKSVSQSEYNFPFEDPWIASISSAAVGYHGVEFKTIYLELRPERRKVPLLEKRNKISINVFQQNSKSAPLVFVIAGTGGTAFAANALILAQQFYELGYHVVTLPNTINFQYVLGVSRTAAPGFTPRDAEEYYQMLCLIAELLVKQKTMRISGYTVVGYSLGGLLAGFVSREDERVGRFNFEKVIMLNPALDIGFVIGLLDQYFEDGDLILSKRKDYIVSQFFAVAMDLYEHGFDVNKINSAIDRLQLSMNEKKWLIGYSFRLNLRDVVFSSQQVHDQGVLNTEVTRWKQNLRFAEALNIGFVEYLTAIVAPTIPGTATIEQLLRDSGMYEIEDHIKSRNNIYILTNADDFIYRPKDFGYMEDLVGSERFTLYPHGGHVGNLWFGKTQSDLENILRLNKDL